MDLFKEVTRLGKVSIRCVRCFGAIYEDAERRACLSCGSSESKDTRLDKILRNVRWK